jgi:T5SS/PEP-CTERM-associated repeat protein
MNRRRCLASLVSSLVLSTTAPAGVITVPGDQPTIQAAIDVARDGDKVLLADGTFTGPGNRGIDPAGKQITICSENGPATCIIDCQGEDRAFVFQSGETPETRVEGLTIRGGLVEESNGGAILCLGSSPSIHDCTFDENTARGTEQFTGAGGAISCRDASHPVISACRFEGNAADGVGPGTGAGGAINCRAGSSPTISGCVFIGNTASGADGDDASASGLGGAIGCGAGASPIIDGCTFTSNSAIGASGNPETGFGGAISLSTDCDAVVTDCAFTTNHAVGDLPEMGIGGAIFVIASDPVITDCDFTGNTAHIAAGGIWIQFSTADVRRCTFEGNTAQSGGAIANFVLGNPTIVECSFTGNSVSSEVQLQQLIGGGAIGSVFSSAPLIAHCEFVGNTSLTGVGGAVSTSSNSVSTIVSCRFRDNHAALGGGAVNTGPLTTPLDAGGTTHLTNCLLTCNGTDGQGGAVFNDSSDLLMTNCTVVANEALASGGGVANTGFASTASLRNVVLYGNTAPAGPQIGDGGPFAPVAASYSLVEGGWPGPGNVDADPMFVDAEGTCDDNDYRLAVGSPAIDAGDNTALPPDDADLDGDGDVLEPTPLDLDGLSRRADDHCAPDTGSGGPPVVDMGAYEARPVIDGCDCNGNHRPDSQDIADGTSLDLNGNGIPDECESPFAGTAAWINPLGGLFRLMTNWEPGTPGVSNDALLGLEETYTVMLDADAETRRLIARRGDVTFDAAPSHGPYEHVLGGVDDASLVIGEMADEEARLTVRGGRLVAIGDVAIGRDPGAVGTLRVVGPAAALNAEQSMCVGCFGTGSLVVDGGARVLSRDATIGDQPESAGSVIVRGAGSTWEVPFFVTIAHGSLVLEDGGVLIAGIDPFSGVFLFGDGRVGGDGHIDGTVLNFGTFEPAIGAGPLTVSSDYFQSGQVPGLGAASGALRVELGGPAPGVEHGQLLVEGDALLAGGLFVDLAGGFEPALGESFLVVEAASSAGRFDVAFLPGLAGSLFMRVEYVAPGGAPTGAEGVAIVIDDLGELFGGFDRETFTLGGTPTGVILEDLNGDAFPDLAIAIPDPDPLNPGQVLVLHNDGTSPDGEWLGFGATQVVPVGREPSGIASGLLDGDGAPDLAVTNALDDTATILINDGFGAFVGQTLPGIGTEPLAVATGDFTDDGVADLAFGLGGTETVVIFENDGGASFTMTSSIPVGTRPGTVDPEDMDEDKDTDLMALGGGSSTVTVVYFDGGLPGEIVEVDVGADPSALTTEDLDANGFQDIVTTNRGDATVSVVLNDGAGLFRPAVDLPVGSDPRAITGIDLEGDGDEDLALVATNDVGDAVVQLLRNDLNDGTQLVFAKAEELAAGDNPLFVLSGDLDQDAADDLVAISDETGGGGAPGPIDGSIDALVNLTSCPGDIDGSGSVGFVDLLHLMAAWGPCDGCREDLDGDGAAGMSDLLILLAAWGPCP